GWVGRCCGSHSDRPPTVEEYFSGFFAEKNLHSHLAGSACHALRHGPTAAHRMVNAMLIFQVRQDGKKTWTAIRRHAEILGLKREGEAKAGVAEVASQLLIEGEPRTQPSVVTIICPTRNWPKTWRPSVRSCSSRPWPRSIPG